MRLNPVSQFLICANDFLRNIAVRVEKFHAARQPGGDDVCVFQKNFAVCLALQPRDPWLNRPYSIHAAALKQSKLIRICGGYDQHIASSLRNLESPRFQPRAAGNVLCVTELWRRDFFSTKIRRGLNWPIWFNNERGASVRCAGEDPDFFAVGFKMRVQSWALSDIGKVERA